MSKHPPAKIDPAELMAFLAEFDDFPTNGLRLSQAAKDNNRSSALIHFFEHLVGEVQSPQRIVEFAGDESRFDISPPEPNGQPQELSIEDVKAAKGDSNGAG